MTIVHVVSRFTPNVIGGAEISVEHLARWQSNNNHKVIVVTPRRSGKNQGIRAELPFKVVEVDLKSVSREQLIRNPLQKINFHLWDHIGNDGEKLVERAIDERPDIIHTHTLTSIGWKALAAINRWNGAHLMTLHDLSLICIQGNKFRNNLRCSKVCSPCLISRCIKSWHSDGLREAGVVAPSSAILQEVGTAWGNDFKLARQVLYTLNLNIRSRSQRKRDVLNILYVGQLAGHKGIDFILSVLQKIRISGWRIRVVGTGQLELSLREKYKGDERICFLGHQPSNICRKEMDESDVLLVPSLWMENSPLVIYEAIASSLPVFASRVGGIPDLVDHGRSGMLIEAGNSSDWTNLLTATIKDPYMLSVLIQGQGDMQRKIDPDAAGHRIIECYRELILTRRLV